MPAKSIPSHVRITIAHCPELSARDTAVPLEMRLARRLLEAQGCTMDVTGSSTTIELPAECASHVER